MSNFEISLVVYFVYGLAYFIMGLVLLLEYWRLTPDAPQKKLFMPLAVFGLIHGIHEWLEILLITFLRLGEPFPNYIAWLRLGLLSVSFLALAIYAYRAFRFGQEYHSRLAIFGVTTLSVFAIIAFIDVISAFSAGSIPLFQMVESLVRYWLGVPAAAVATIGLGSGARRALADHRQPLDRYLTLTALGFAIYSLTQLFVPVMNTRLASIFNTTTFQAWTSIPIPVFRTIAGIIIMAGLILVTNFLETERQKIITEAQKARLKALEQEEAIQRILLRQTVAAQEEERTRIARELHDEMAQTLTAFSLELATLQKELGGQRKYQVVLTRIQNLGKQMSQDIQHMISDLRPAHLDDLGLVPTLRFLADQARSQFGLSVTVETTGKVQRLESMLETTIYRIVQESLTNIARHANTKQAAVNLSYSLDTIDLEIIDLGAGFEPEFQISTSRGWGLIGIRERAESAGGNVTIRSKPGQGTTIQVIFPLTMAGEQLR